MIGHRLTGILYFYIYIISRNRATSFQPSPLPMPPSLSLPHFFPSLAVHRPPQALLHYVWRWGWTFLHEAMQDSEPSIRPVVHKAVGGSPSGGKHWVNQGIIVQAMN
jgi:hypothetical protein